MEGAPRAGQKLASQRDHHSNLIQSRVTLYSKKVVKLFKLIVIEIAIERGGFWECTSNKSCVIGIARGPREPCSHFLIGSPQTVVSKALQKYFIVFLPL
jgi:hypothetical protein